MRYFAVIIAVAIMVSCGDKAFLKNQTTPGGYALGEKVELRFATDRTENAPDSIMAYVIEKKTDFRYSLGVGKVGCDKVCEYRGIWDGRKPDGRWPAGGRYQVYAVMEDGNVYSDTVQIGLGD